MKQELNFWVLKLLVIMCSFSIIGSADTLGRHEGDAVSPIPPPLIRGYHSFPHTSHSFSKVPTIHGSGRHTLLAPSESPSRSISRGHTNSLESSPEYEYYKHHHHHHHYNAKDQYGNSALTPSYFATISHHYQTMGRAYKISPFRSPYSSTSTRDPPVPAPSPTSWQMLIQPPSASPLVSPPNNHAPPSSTFILPSPPPNQDCSAVTCAEPLTYTPSGIPCGCVWPMQVRLQFNMALYTFFPLVSKLATEIASSLALDQSQVRIMGANAGSQQLDKTVVLVNLVPHEGNFNHATALSLYEMFWNKQVHVNPSLFGAYEVLDVHYPGLPPSPPSVSSNLAAMEDHPLPANYKGNSGSSLKPLGVDIPKTQKSVSDHSMLAVIVVSVITAFSTCAAIAWILIARRRSSTSTQEASTTAVSSFTKPSGAPKYSTVGSKSRSRSLSFSSGVLKFHGSVKIFSLHEIELATAGFDTSRILGEGGFGVVYRGIFDYEDQVAVKVLKKDKRHGIHEFLSEVEMLSRLHHKNLVKLLGICTEDQFRCLIYELVPNGSVESHLHGEDKGVAPLDWATRMKIALGTARGLAYLHEDSNPCVIHRDLKSSNILLDHDFTPKVSDFGLATNALDEGNQPISTHVIGTFGYLAPEYAMTGHLLVKSDVYSYGVVLLELLTGRKPVDFTKPPGQENLVNWALPLLATKEGLDIVIDPVLKPSAPFDSLFKVAAIASMCVQPEVSRRPFMGEVVQALKLVCSELDDANDQEGSGIIFNQTNTVGNNKSGEIPADFQVYIGTNYSPLGYESGCDAKLPSSAVDLSSGSAEFAESKFQNSGRQFGSGPLEPGRKKPFWQRLRRLSRNRMKEHLWSGTR